jgi:predicted lipid-binding transport protein (Tim44 family)
LNLCRRIPIFDVIYLESIVMFNGKRVASWGMVLAMLGALSFLATAADARVGGGGSSGSRGGRTYSAPPSTNTSPRAAPIEKSITQPSATAQAPLGGASRFGGWRGILMGGLIGGLLASIFGFGALASVLGFILQVALIGGIIWLVMAYFRNRQAQPAMASASTSGSRPAPNVDYRLGAGGGGSTPLSVEKEDYDAFERLLGEIQLAYGRRDERALGERVTPEMLSYFAQELEDNRRKGLRNEVSDPKLLQGDLAEAWREGRDEYATVAMRFSLKDATVDDAGRVVSGSRTTPEEVTEIWTFRRPVGGTAHQWELSAIQQGGKNQRLAS